MKNSAERIIELLVAISDQLLYITLLIIFFGSLLFLSGCAPTNKLNEKCYDQCVEKGWEGVSSRNTSDVENSKISCFAVCFK